MEGLLKEVRTRRLLYVTLAATQFVLGVVTFAVGVAAFSYTTTYTVGSFWAGPVLIVVGVYNKVVLLIRVSCDHRCVTSRHRRQLAAVSVLLNFISVAVSLAAAVVDVMAAYFLEQTDFSRCSYTPDALTASCESDICPHLRVPARSCYCCYLYEYRDNGGCETPLLAAKQTYFSSVSSCDVIPNALQPLLYSLSALSVAGTLVNILFLFKSSPALGSHDEEKGERIEKGEERERESKVEHDQEKGERKEKGESKVEHQRTLVERATESKQSL